MFEGISKHLRCSRTGLTLGKTWKKPTWCELQPSSADSVISALKFAERVSSPADCIPPLELMFHPIQALLTLQVVDQEVDVRLGLG